MSATTPPLWVQRYTATVFGFPSWNEDRPNQLALVSNRSGTSQVWAHDLGEGSWRQASDEQVGVETTWVLPDGRIAWWRDLTGAERGHLVAVPFEGGPAEAVFPEMPDGWLMGLSFAAGRMALGAEVDGTYRIVVTDPDARTREIATFDRAAGVGGGWSTTHGGLSADGALVCVTHAEHGDILHNALRVFEVETGAVVGDLEDRGRNLEASVWSPDHRLIFTSELGTFERPSVWDPRTGERHDIAVELPGGVFPIDRFPDGTLLARHESRGRRS